MSKSGQRTQTSRKNPTSAEHVIAGFRYQLLQSIDALINLRDGETLLLEVSEDFSVVSRDSSVDVQVKNSQAVAGPPAYSLQTSDIRNAIARYWEASNSPENGAKHLVFIARGGAAVEREFAFPDGLPGLHYWKLAALDADTNPLRSALQKLFPDHPLGQWLASSPSDEELRTRLLRRINWQLEQEAADTLVDQAREQIRTIYASKNWPISAANQAVKSLIAMVFEVASRPDPAERALNRLDLYEELEGAAGIALLSPQAASPVVESDQDILITELEPLFMVAGRSSTVDELGEKIKGRSLVWLHGAHGVGKSILARLLASRMAGRWLVLDVWPVRQDSVASMAAWRALLRTIRNEAVDGVIVDDFVSEGGKALRSRLVAFARTFSTRGGRVIVTSHQAPSPAHLADFGSHAPEVVPAPYFSDADIAELVSIAPAPSENMIKPWAGMIRMTTGGGLPLLAAAKIASLRARGWPDSALVEDFGLPSQAVQLTREEARRDLLADLRELDDARSLDAGQLLRRIACVFDRADDGLVMKLSTHSPTLRNGGDALSVLRGSWLEILPHDGLRVSPLIADIAADVPAEDAKTWRRVAAEYWLAKRILNERTLPLCFWNAFWGEHDGVLLELLRVIQVMSKEKLQAAAPLLSAMTALMTDRPIYGGNAIIATYMRLVQFEIADAVEEPDVAGRVADRLLIEITELPTEVAALIMLTAGPKVLTASAANIGPALRLGYALRVRAAFPLAAKVSDGEIDEMRSLLPPQFTADMDMADFLFAAIVPHLRNSRDTLETFKALDDLAPEIRNRFIDAISALYSGPGVFVNAGWSGDQLEKRDMTAALAAYDEIEEIASLWSRPDLEAEIASGRSVILDEGLNRPVEALAAIDAAIAKLGLLPAIVRQKSKVLGHLDRHAEAAELLLSIEDEIGRDSSLERGYALSDGGVSAAKAGRFGDAIRLFDKAHTALVTNPENAPLAAANLVEKALAQWRADLKSDALLTAADTFDAVGEFPPDQSRQAERSHQFARALVGLFFAELLPDDAAPPFTFGQASSLEAVNATPMGVDLKPLADNWRILASIESALDLNIGIDARSMSKQTGPLNLGIESFLWAGRYTSALRNQHPDAALRAGAVLVNIFRLKTMATVDEQGVPRADPADFNLVNPGMLLETNEYVDATLSLFIDLILARALCHDVDIVFLESLRRAGVDVFGVHPEIDAIERAASQLHAVGADAARAAVLAHGIAFPNGKVESDPAIRFYRDMITMAHLSFSLGKSELVRSVASRTINGWQQVLERQRFLLRNPGKNVPLIKTAIAQSENEDLPAIARLLLAAAGAVNHHFADGWFDPLRRLSGNDQQRVSSMSQSEIRGEQRAIACVLKKPADCSDAEIENFCALVEKGGEVTPGLRQRVIDRGVMLAFVYDGDIVAAVGGLKTPYASYKQKVFKKANSDRHAADFEAELGWVFVSDDYRGRGISGTICDKLISVADANNSGVYATSSVSNTKMHATLARAGFSKSGVEYKSERDDDRLLIFIRPKPPNG
jgi:GNAT superfamily N-acetyltransferase